MSSVPKAASVAVASGILAPMCAVILGAVLIYLAGFANADALHAGAHDARHSAALPCH